MILGRGSFITGLGLLIEIAGAFGLTRFLSGLLYRLARDTGRSYGGAAIRVIVP